MLICFVCCLGVVILMPLTFSIAEGISMGFVSYAAIKLLSGKAREVHVGVWVLAAIFLAKFILTGA